MKTAMQMLISAAGVGMGAAITYMVNVRDRRRRHVEQLFNDAIAAVAAAEAAMQFINNVPSEAGLSSARAADLEQDLREESYRRFVQLVALAREALAKVVPYREDLRPYVVDQSSVYRSAEQVTAELKKGPEG